jgi:hypothetical protein
MLFDPSWYTVSSSSSSYSLEPTLLIKGMFGVWYISMSDTDMKLTYMI